VSQGRCFSGCCNKIDVFVIEPYVREWTRRIYLRFHVSVCIILVGRLLRTHCTNCEDFVNIFSVCFEFLYI